MLGRGGRRLDLTDGMIVLFGHAVSPSALRLKSPSKKNLVLGKGSLEGYIRSSSSTRSPGLAFQARSNTSRAMNTPWRANTAGVWASVYASNAGLLATNHQGSTKRSGSSTHRGGGMLPSRAKNSAAPASAASKRASSVVGGSACSRAIFPGRDDPLKSSAN